MCNAMDGARNDENVQADCEHACEVTPATTARGRTGTQVALERHRRQEQMPVTSTDRTPKPVRPQGLMPLRNPRPETGKGTAGVGGTMPVRAPNEPDGRFSGGVADPQNWGTGQGWAPLRPRAKRLQQREQAHRPAPRQSTCLHDATKQWTTAQRTTDLRAAPRHAATTPYRTGQRLSPPTGKGPGAGATSCITETMGFSLNTKGVNGLMAIQAASTRN